MTVYRRRPVHPAGRAMAETIRTTASTNDDDDAKGDVEDNDAVDDADGDDDEDGDEDDEDR